MFPDKNNITQLLIKLQAGNREVIEDLMPVVYEQLREMAQRHLYGERPNHTLNATALAHEAYLKLVDQKRVTWQNRAHFFAVASQAMRRILINYAHKQKAEKRGGGQVVATFDERYMVRETKTDELLQLDDALSQLANSNKRLSQVVEYRFFGGLTQEEIAEVLRVSVPTVRRDWRLARAWLSRELSSNN